MGEKKRKLIYTDKLKMIAVEQEKLKQEAFQKRSEAARKGAETRRNKKKVA